MSRSADIQRGLFTALPFLLLFVVQDLRLDTQVDIRGSGLRRIEVEADPRTVDVVLLQDMMRTVIPGSREGRSQRGQNEVLWRDDRIADIAAPDGVELAAEGTLLSPRVSYTYKDTIFIQSDQITEAQAAAAPNITLTYSVRLPGKVDETSVMPPAQVDGSTVTWTLKADKEKHELSASAVATRYDYVAFSVCVALLAIWLIVRLILERRRRSPIRV